MIYGNIHGVDVSPFVYPHDPQKSMSSFCLRNNQALLIDDLEEERAA